MMYHLVTILCVAAALLSTSCTSESTFGEPPASNAPTITVTEAMDPTTYGRAITVRGTVARVCQQEGCWMTITDGHLPNAPVVRVQVEGGSWYVPTTLTGEVVVAGTVREEVYSQEDARAMAETLGWSAARVQQMVGDQRMPLFLATGLQILDEQRE